MRGKVGMKYINLLIFRKGVTSLRQQLPTAAMDH